MFLTVHAGSILKITKKYDHTRRKCDRLYLPHDLQNTVAKYGEPIHYRFILTNTLLTVQENLSLTIILTTRQIQNYHSPD